MIQKPRDGAEGWYPDMPAPLSFSAKQIAEFQKRIDDAVGTRDGRSIVKLAWAPSEKRWRPHPHGAESPGYTFPIFIAYCDDQGHEVAAPRFVLLERLEPPQYAPMWEDGRYTVEHEKYAFATDDDGSYLKDSLGNPILVHASGDGKLWDWKGPCPSERYVELWCHAYHDGICCPCIKYGICECGEQYDHCWGRYLDPNERLLDWVRARAFEAQRDSDVQPDADVRYMETSNAQQELKSAALERRERAKQQRMEFNAQMLSHWERKPHSVGTT